MGDFSSKLGRHVITLDNHRFLGHVGWRQDRQTFDAFTANYAPSEELKFKYVCLDERNRIFAEECDVGRYTNLLPLVLVIGFIAFASGIVPEIRS